MIVLIKDEYLNYSIQFKKSESTKIDSEKNDWMIVLIYFV